METIMRYRIADYYQLPGIGATPGAFKFMGVGFTTLDENPAAQTDEKIYIHERASTINVISYQTTFPFEADKISSEPVIEDIYDIATRHYTGALATRQYVRMETWRESTDVPGAYAARLFNVSVQVDSIAGPGGEVVVLGGNLNALGDPVIGIFNPETMKFTATATTPDEEI